MTTSVIFSYICSRTRELRPKRSERFGICFGCDPKVDIRQKHGFGCDPKGCIVEKRTFGRDPKCCIREKQRFGCDPKH